MRSQLIIDWNVRSNYRRVWWSWTFWIIHLICRTIWIFVVIVVVEIYEWNLFIFQLKQKKMEQQQWKLIRSTDWMVKIKCKKFLKFATKTVSHNTLRIVQYTFQVQACKQINTLTKLKLKKIYLLRPRIAHTTTNDNFSLDNSGHWIFLLFCFILFYFFFVWLRVLYTLYTSAIECNCFFMAMVVMFCLLFLVWLYFVFYTLVVAS